MTVFRCPRPYFVGISKSCRRGFIKLLSHGKNTGFVFLGPKIYNNWSFYDLLISFRRLPNVFFLTLIHSLLTLSSHLSFIRPLEPLLFWYLSWIQFQALCWKALRCLKGKGFFNLIFIVLAGVLQFHLYVPFNPRCPSNSTFLYKFPSELCRYPQDGQGQKPYWVWLMILSLILSGFQFPWSPLRGHGNKTY